MNGFRSIYASDLSHRAKSVYMYLKDRADSEGRCWPAIKTIALELGLSRSTVKRALDDLVRAGLLRKDPRWRENGSYTSNAKKQTLPARGRVCFLGEPRIGS